MDNKKFLDQLLRDRYFQPNESSWRDVCIRVSSFIAHDEYKRYKYTFFNMMNKKEFCPASPIIMSAGTRNPMLSSCFVLPLEDSMQSILNTLKDIGIVTCCGGGIGLDFSTIRPENSLIKSLGKKSSLGPVGVLKIINSLINELKQSGRRKGACLGSISVYHDDLYRFIDSKTIDGNISNFNLSVLVDDKFMNGVDSIYKDKFDKICLRAYESGCPGILFKDAINKNSVFLDKYGIEITTANTCGEIPMPAYGNCLLGSVNISKMIHDGKFHAEKFMTTLKNSVIFLNACLDSNKLPLEKLNQFKSKYRQIGLGITGFHDALILQSIEYGSDESFKFAKQVAEMLSEAKRFAMDKFGNTTVLTLAPTGSVSILLETMAFSIDPIFNFAVNRQYIDSEGNVNIYKLVHPYLKHKNESNSNLYKTSMEISAYKQLKMVSVFQEHIDNAISKTIILPSSSSIDDVKRIFKQAWNLGLKGITIYVDKSKKGQVYFTDNNNNNNNEIVIDKEVNKYYNKDDNKKKRPRLLNGATFKCRSSSGSFYITLNELDGTAFEIFSTPNISALHLDRKEANEMITNIEALTRIISLCLRSGISAKTIAEQLSRVKNQSILSLPYQISKILKSFKPLHEQKSAVITKKCALCSAQMIFDGSCFYCTKCGWSMCD